MFSFNPVKFFEKDPAVLKEENPLEYGAVCAALDVSNQLVAKVFEPTTRGLKAFEKLVLNKVTALRKAKQDQFEAECNEIKIFLTGKSDDKSNGDYHAIPLTPVDETADQIRYLHKKTEERNSKLCLRVETRSGRMISFEDIHVMAKGSRFFLAEKITLDDQVFLENFCCSFLELCGDFNLIGYKF